MLRFLFDTDHLTLYEHGHARLGERLSNQVPGDIGISVVSAEEALRGRLAALAKARDGDGRIRCYQRFAGTIAVFHEFPLIVFDQRSEDHLQRLLSLRLRIGSKDLRIASIALSHGLTLLTRNRQDFSRVPGIVLEDWS
jgi:tRNA(fMet)-specific endonuclease VapC